MKQAIKYFFSAINKRSYEYRLALITLFFVGVAIDVFYFHDDSDVRLFLLLLFWFYITRLYRFKVETTLKVALFFLGPLFFLFIFVNASFYSERLAVWIYMFLVLGLVQQVITLWRDEK